MLTHIDGLNWLGMVYKLPEKTNTTSYFFCEQQNTLVFNQTESLSFVCLRASRQSGTVLLAPQYNKQLPFSTCKNSNANYVISKCISNWNIKFLTVKHSFLPNLWECFYTVFLASEIHWNKTYNSTECCPQDTPIFCVLTSASSKDSKLAPESSHYPPVPGQSLARTLFVSSFEFTEADPAIPASC